MKVYVRIGIFLEKKTAEGRKIYNEFRKRMEKYSFDGMPSYRVELNSEDYTYAQDVMEYCKIHDVGIDMSDEGPNERVYTKKDYQDAVAYRVWFLQNSYNEYEDVEDEEENCCEENKKHGMHNMVQVRPQYLQKKEFGKKNCTQLMNCGYAVSEAVKNDLLQLGAIEEDFWPVYTKQKEIVCYQLMPTHKVSLGEINGWKKEIVCPYCGYADYEEDDRYPIYIDKKTLEQLKPLNATEETLGGAPMYLIVTKEVYEFLTSKYKRMNIEPIFLKE